MVEAIAITKTAILAALAELTNYEEGFRFQALGVILAKNKCRELKASEPKQDLGLDAYAPGELFENGLGRGVACSNTATLAKIRADIEEARQHFTDLKILFFATPRQVSEKRAEGWREKVRKDYGITLVVISREEVISELLKPENASLCSSILRIPSALEASLEQLATDCRDAVAEINAWWVPRIPRNLLIDLSADELGNLGNQTGLILELTDLQEMLVQSRRVVLEAPAGRGKTTTLTQIAERCISAGNLPFIVDLASWAQTGQDILEYIAGMHPFRARSIDANKLAQIYEAQHFVFLLNGWNEIAEVDSHRAQTALGSLERQYAKAGILVATRSHRVKPPLPGTTVRARLRVLNLRQRADYVRARLGVQSKQVLSRIQTEPVLNNLTLTPLFLSEVVSIVAAGKGMPTTKMGVLREVVHLPEGDPTHRGALESFPLTGQADRYLTELSAVMTANSQTQILEPEAKQITNGVLLQLRDLGDAVGSVTVVQILAALVDHHVLERVDYPVPTYRLQHQQMQEYYAAQFVEQKLLELVAEKRQSESIAAVASSATAKLFQTRYVNQTSWSEPLSMVAGDQDNEISSTGPDTRLHRSKAVLVFLALSIDLIFAAELFELCSTAVRALVADQLSGVIRERWASAERPVRSQALTAMIATGSDLFKQEILLVLNSADEESRFAAYRSTSTFRLSSLGPNWQYELRALDENARLAFASEFFFIAGSIRELAEFALADPSLRVRARAFSNLMWMVSDDETIKLLMAVDEAAFEAVIEQAQLSGIHPLFHARALKVYRKILAESSDPEKRLKAAGNAVLMGQLDAHAALRESLEERSAEWVRQVDKRELRALIEALSSDREWRSKWVVRQVLEGGLNAQKWATLIDPIGPNLKDSLLRRLETEDFSRGQAAGVQDLLRMNADAEMARRLFARIVDIHKTVADLALARSENSLTRARELGELKRQIEGFLRTMPVQAMVDGILAALSPKFSLAELEVLGEFWDWPMNQEAELYDVLTDESRASALRYLTGAVPRLTNENDPRGNIRAHLAVAISRIGEPGDLSYVAALLESETGRIRAAQTARAAQERSQLALGSQIRYTNRYTLAVRQLRSDKEGVFLANLLTEPEHERQVVWALIEWALEISVPTTIWMEGWSNRERQMQEIWSSRTSGAGTRFDETRRKAAVGYLRTHVEALALGLSADTPDPQIVWRLKDLMVPLATLDSKDSAALILKTLALPLKTHGVMDGWKRIKPLQIMLFEGAALPNDQTLAIITPVVDELNSKWHSDNDRSLLGMSLTILPFLENPRAGIEALTTFLQRTRMPLGGMSRVVSALGHSRSDYAVDLLISIAPNDNTTSSLGDGWISALAALDTPRSRQILMSLIDPESRETVKLPKFTQTHALSRRIAEMAEKNLATRCRILSLCQMSLDRAKRDLLASVIAQLGDSESIIGALYMLDDEMNPELPYNLLEAVKKVFVEHRPEGNTLNSHSLHPRAANEVRDKIIEMARSDTKRKVAAAALLARIESWRLMYGRPAGETRNPFFEA